MAKLDRGGVAIHYDIEGEGPVLLLSHGYSATGEMWRDQVEALKDRFRVVTWDMRGHGRSDYPDEPAAYSEALTVGDMAALLDAASVERAVLGGLSLGGYMSLAFNLAHPERVRALVVIDTGPGYRSDEAREGWNKNALRTAERYETEGLARLQRGTAEMRASSHRDASGLVRAARGMLTQRDAAVISSLPTIAVPSLVVVGANDAPFLAAADYMAGKIPGAKKVIIPDAGHAANMDQPAAFNAAVRGFLLEAGLDQAP